MSCWTHAEVRAADEAGFDAFFLPEFHQTRAGGVISPLLTGAALAEGTRRIRVGQAVVPGPLYHPVRAAGAAAGRPVRIGMFRDAWIGGSRAECEKVWLPHALALRMRQPGGPGHEATLTALARFGEEVIKPMGGTG
jgi:hypothetical protein